jgi:2-polyprenyl-6-methoxyphenol hydroxylase-like FAD-dependent oxidoreductase
MLRLFGGYHQPIPALIQATDSIVKLNVFDIASLPVWWHGRVALIGDAAHAVSPNAGQGASMALEDAMYLAKLLSRSEDYGQVFAQFERDRKPRVERIVAEGRRRGLDKQVVSPFQASVRELMMRIALNLFGPHADDWLYQYRIDWDAAREPATLRIAG